MALALPGSALAQVKGSPEHPRAAMARMDAPSIEANPRTTEDLPSHGLARAVDAGTGKRLRPRPSSSPQQAHAARRLRLPTERNRKDPLSRHRRPAPSPFTSRSET